MKSIRMGAQRFGQTGIALVVGLIFLVILTLLGIAALGNNTLQARMAYGASEANLAFQSAETALSAGETWLLNQTVRPTTGCAIASAGTPTNYTAVGNCGQSAATAAFIWPRPRDPSVTPPIGRTQFFDESWWISNGRRFGFAYADNTVPAAEASQAFVTGTVNEVPRYVIEELGPDISGSLVQGQGRPYTIYDYQITARSFGAQDSTRTIVQSTYGQGF